MKSTLHTAQEYCLLEGIPYHLEEDCACSKGMLHILEDSSIVFKGIACWKNIVLSQRKIANEWIMFLYEQGILNSLLHFILHFRTGMQYYVKFMLLYATYYGHMFPVQGKPVLFLRTPCICSTKTLYFARGRRRVHATILMISRCKYISISVFLNCVCAYILILCLMTHVSM